MNIGESLETNGIEIKKFRPHAAHFRKMDDFVVITRNTSSVTRWLGRLHLEHICAHDGALIGFRIANAKSFSSRFVPLILLQALCRDLQNKKEHSKKPRHVLVAYLQAFRLTLKIPSTWRVCE